MFSSTTSECYQPVKMKLHLNLTENIQKGQIWTLLRPAKKGLNFSFILVLSILFFFQIDNAIAGRREKTDSVNALVLATEPPIYPSSIWLAAQLIPSPQLLTLKNNPLQFGLRWQVTPLLYSFGINKRLKPWRTFVVEPMTRQNGSVELYFSPEYLNLTDHFKSNWLFRGGIRAYLPVYRYGEYLSASFSTSYYTINGNQGFSYEAGIYLFFGILGFQVTYSPQMKSSPVIFTLRLRYF